MRLNTSLALLAIIATFRILATSTTSMQRTTAALSTANITSVPLPLTLGNPYYVEYDKTTSQKPVVINGTTHATEITFSGHGMTTDINFTDNGKALIIPRDTTGSVVLLQGNDSLISSGGDKTSL